MGRAWYPMYAGDFERDTGDLSLAEVGAYIRLMNHYYSTRTPLPIDEAKLYRVCGAVSKAERRAVQSVIRRYFDAKLEQYSHRRIDQELSRSNEISALQSKRASSRWHTSGNAVAMPEDMPPQPQPHIKEKQRARAHCLPEDWQPNSHHHSLAVEHRRLLGDEVERFRDWAKGGAKTYADWDATFNNWLRNDKYRSNGHGQRQYVSPAQQRVNRTRQNAVNVLRKQALASEGIDAYSGEQQNGTVGSHDRGVDARILELLPGKII